jgi:hypothetical protein
MLLRPLSLGLLLLVAACGAPEQDASGFTVVVVPDTQNYVDYTLQKSAGFALDSSELFITQMQHIASKAESKGGDLAFVTSVGDIWQHVISGVDEEHFARGVLPIDASTHPIVRPDETRGFEIPKAVEGYRLISEAGIPFGVVPGNHDYDAWWSVALPRGNGTSASARDVHIGGFTAFNAAFGADSEFFKDKDWYVESFNGGANSAQLFSAGGYRFLNLSLEMQPGDAVLAWAQSVVDSHPGIPTFVTTHDYLNPRGERLPTMDLATADPSGNNSAEVLWQKFISRNDQILMVFSGHQFGAATRIDTNVHGHKVYQLLSDYQARGMAALDAGQAPGPGGRQPGLGDGWYRELHFDLDAEVPRVEVRTYSSHYRQYASELDSYAQWYRLLEQPQLDDAAFVQADAFVLPLDDFRARFGMPTP